VDGAADGADDEESQGLTKGLRAQGASEREIVGAIDYSWT